MVSSKMLEFVSPISEAYDIILIQVDILIYHNHFNMVELLLGYVQPSGYGS